MADGTCNIALGEVVHYAKEARDTTNAALVIVLLKAAEADDTLNNYDTLSAILGAAGNTEADFTNYARKTVSGANVTVTVDDAGNRVDVDFPDQVWSSAGGTTDNTLVKALVGYDPDTTVTDDTTIVPLTHHDFAVTTDGTDLTLQVSSSGFFRAS